MSRPAAALLITGDEVVAGRTRDLNGPLVASSLSERGFAVVKIVLAPDDAGTIETELRDLVGRGVDLVVVTGGLGTTHDDLTLVAVRRVAGVRLVEDPEALGHIEAATRRIAARRGLDYDELLVHTRSQAMVPEGAELIAPAGLAPGFVVRVDTTHVCVLPGVPAEVRVMWPTVLERLSSLLDARGPARLVLRTYGVGEIHVQPFLDTASRDHLTVGITAAEGEVIVTATYDAHDAVARAQAKALELAVRQGTPVFSDDGSSVDDLIARALRERSQTLAVAESCTGGLLGARLTQVAGSSEYFLGGIVSYDNRVKEGLLRVPPDVLAQQGAVSAEVAGAMAQGTRTSFGATYGVAITGIAGPGGGTPAKPVGLVYVACSNIDRTRVEEFRFPGDRESVRAWATTSALHLIYAALI